MVLNGGIIDDRDGNTVDSIGNPVHPDGNPVFLFRENKNFFVLKTLNFNKP